LKSYSFESPKLDAFNKTFEAILTERVNIRKLGSWKIANFTLTTATLRKKGRGQLSQRQ
jgi:hypothetical protein